MYKAIFLKLVALFITSNLYSQTLPADINFNTNTWTVDGSVISLSGNEYTIVGASSGIRKVYLDVPVSSTYTTVYITAEIELTNIGYGDRVYKAPRVKIYKGGTTNLLVAENLTKHPFNTFYKVGVKVKKYNTKGISSLRVEFLMQSATGTMKIKNPVITNVEPAMDFVFPFSVPATPTYNLDINTSNKHTFNNDLLSTNSHFRFLNGSYSWSSAETTQVINNWFPQTNFRFPGGTVGNYYNWNTDKYHPQGTSGITIGNHSTTLEFGYPAYKTICLNNNASSTLMFNVLIDTPAEAKNRYQSRKTDGLDVKWIELGNENFFSDQQGGNVTDVSSYITHTKSMITQLKTVDPNVKAAVCLEKDYYYSGSWNDDIKTHIATDDYFEAATFHNYNNTNSFLYSGSTVYKMMQSYKITQDRVSKFSTNFPGKDALITEWGVLSDDIPVNFTQTLASADVFLALEKGHQQGIVKQAGIHMLWKNNNYSESTLTFLEGGQMKLSALGVMYSSLFEVFKDNDVYDAYSSGPELETNLEGLYAKAVNTGTDYKLFVVNKLPVTSTLNFAVDGVAYNGNYSIKTFSEDITSELTTAYADNTSPWSTSSQTATAGNLSIPAYSISIITINHTTCTASSENIIANGSAECLIADSWSSEISSSTDAEATFSDESTIINGGSNAFKIATTKVNTLATPKLGDIKIVNTKYNGDFNGKTISVDVWAKSDVAAQIGIQLKVDKTAGGSDFRGIFPTITTSYVKYTLTAKITEATSGITLRLLAGKTVANYYFDDIKGLVDDKITWTGNTGNNWSVPTNWDPEVVPLSTTDVVIPAGLSNYPTATNAITVNSINIESGATLKATNTFTGTATYNRTLANGSQWYLISSPVIGETFNAAWASTNSIPASTLDTGNLGINWYNNTSLDTDTDGVLTDDSATGHWRYLESNDNNSSTFKKGQGYGIIRSNSGDITFEGTGIYTSTETIGITQGASNNYNLIGNPFTAFLNLGDFLADNPKTTVLTESEAYFWNGSFYETKTSLLNGNYEIAPGQGFFVETAANTNVTFDVNDITHQGTDTFLKSSRSKIKLFVSDGVNNRFAHIYFINGTTTGLDSGYDGKLFGGVSYNFALYTHLLDNDEGNKYQIQCLPDSNYENMVIPVGVIAAANKEITFTTETQNLPDGINVYIEDREKNTFTQLNKTNSNYTIKINEKLNGIGRFYLHTKNNILSTSDIALHNLSVYKLDESHLRVVGLPQGKSSIKLFTVLGKQILNSTFISNGIHNVSIPKLTAGIYFVKLQSEKGSIKKKILIK